MKKILVVFLLIISFTFGVNIVLAVDVSAKYTYIENDTISKTVIDKQSVIKVKNGEITFINNNNNKYILKLLEVNDEKALLWLKDVNGISSDDYFVYNFIVLDKNNELTNDVVFNYNSLMNEPYMIKVIDNEGKVINNNKICSSNFIVIEKNSSIKTIKYNYSVGGSIIVDGKIINKSGEYFTKSNTIVIRSEAGYVIDKVYINNEEVTDKVVLGILKLDEYDTIVLRIVSVREDVNNNDNKYVFSGKVIYNGIPLVNAMVELHSIKRITTTDSNGNFYYNDVEVGRHSITISYDNNVIGYSEFKISDDDGVHNIVELSSNDVIPITDGLVLSINDDDEYKIYFKNYDTIKKNNNYVILFIVFCIVIIIRIFIKKKKELY